MDGLYKEIYEFASSAGALEGYVYQKKEINADDLDNWIKNLVKQYRKLPLDVRESFQSSLDRTIGRAVQSLIPVFGGEHAHVIELKSLVTGKMPDGPDDFEEEKKEKADI